MKKILHIKDMYPDLVLTVAIIPHLINEIYIMSISSLIAKFQRKAIQICFLRFC